MVKISLVVIEWNDHPFMPPPVQYVFQPAMLDPGHGMDRVEEGVAIFTRHTITEWSYILLTWWAVCACVRACVLRACVPVWYLETGVKPGVPTSMQLFQVSIPVCPLHTAVTHMIKALEWRNLI